MKRFVTLFITIMFVFAFSSCGVVEDSVQEEQSLRLELEENFIGAGDIEETGAVDKSDGTGIEPVSTDSDSKIIESETAQLVLPEKKPIPEGGWTYETLLDSIWINGKYVQFPCKLSDLGEGFEFDETGFFLQQDDEVTQVELKFNGNRFAIAKVLNPPSHDYVNDGYIYSLTILAVGKVMGENSNIYPLAINGITIGSPIDHVTEHFNSGDYSDNGVFSSRLDYRNASNNRLFVSVTGEDDLGIYFITIETT